MSERIPVIIDCDPGCDDTAALLLAFRCPELDIRGITTVSGNVALVVGGEDSGVRRITRENCDFTLSIPLRGKVNSLNASVALGIAAYEVVKTRL